MKAGRLRLQTSRTGRIVASGVSLASICLIGVLLAFISTLLGSNYDSPPTWYFAVTILLVGVDAAAICYIIFKTVHVLTRKSASTRLLKLTVVTVALLAIAHSTTVYAYSRIPQWDFQDNLFDDLSWPGPGKVSQDCRAQPDQSASARDSALTSPVPGAQRPTSLQEILQIAQIQDWKARYGELENRTAAGWHGWVQDVERHGYYSNPEHRLVSLFLHDPYSNTLTATFSQWPEAVVSYFDSAGIGKLTVGQEVLVCGDISIDNAANSDADLHISISRPVLNPLPLPEAISSVQVPPDFSLEYEVHGCAEGYECPDYSLKIDAQGNLTYQGNADVQQVPGTHTTHLSQDRLRQLVFELQRAKLFEMADVPEKLQENLPGATVIRARMDGRSKTVVLPWVGTSWPARVTMLAGKIEEVSNLQQWVTLVTSP